MYWLEKVPFTYSLPAGKYRHIAISTPGHSIRSLCGCRVWAPGGGMVAPDESEPLCAVCLRRAEAVAGIAELG